MWNKREDKTIVVNTVDKPEYRRPFIGYLKSGKCFVGVLRHNPNYGEALDIYCFAFTQFEEESATLNDWDEIVNDVDCWQYFPVKE